MKKYKVTLKTANAAQFISYGADGTKKYSFKFNEPVVISDENVIEQLRKQQGYEIEEI